MFVKCLWLAAGLGRHVCARDNFQQVEIAFLVLGNQNKPIRHRFAGDFANSRLITITLHAHLHAKDRLNAGTA